MRHRDITALKKISDEIEIASDMIKEVSFEEFSQDEVLKRALCMTAINIGELVKNLSDELRAEYKNIPWKLIAGFRDIAAHKYQTLKAEDVYETVTCDFPKLFDDIREILKTEN